MLRSRAYNSLFFVCFSSLYAGIILAAQMNIFILFCFILLAFNYFFIFCFKSFRENILQPSKLNIYALILLIVVLITMLIRGIGFEFLGDHRSGGMTYVKLFVSLLLFLSIIPFASSINYFKVCFFSILIAAAFPFLSDLFYILIGSENYFSKLFEGSSTIGFYNDNLDSGDSLFRIQSAEQLAESVTCCMLYFTPIFTERGNFRLTLKNLIFIFIILGLIGISGHRLALLNSLFFVGGFYYIKFGILNIRRKLIYILIGITLLFLVVIKFYDQLPTPFQRVFSFLPLVNSNDVILDANNSSNFRLILAAKAFSMIPDYFIIGKGFAFNNYNVAFTDYFGLIEHFGEMGAFHNGVLGLIVNLGFLGLLFAILWFVKLFQFVSAKVYNLNRFDNDFIILLKLKILILILYFILFYGDMHTNFIEIVAFASFYKALYINHIKDSRFTKLPVYSI